MSKFKYLSAASLAVAMLSMITGCSKQEQAKVEKAGTEMKASAEAGAKAAADAAKEAEAFALASEAYIYAYPLVTMEMTRRVMTNVATPEGTRAPMGQFVRMREYPSAKFRDVTAPNADTLYTTAWVDVSKEPWILSIPDMKGRYFLFPMLDGGPMCFRFPASVRPAPRRRNMPSPVRGGQAPCPQA